MNHQPQISTISSTAPPSYLEAMNQPPVKDHFYVPPSMPHPYGPYEQPASSTVQYPTTYQEYNVTQPSYNPMFVTIPPTQQQNPTQTPQVVTTRIVARKYENGICSSCVRISLFVILVVCLTIYLLKVIISIIVD